MPVIAMQDVRRELHTLQRLQRRALKQNEATMLIDIIGIQRGSGKQCGTVDKENRQR